MIGVQALKTVGVSRPFFVVMPRLPPAKDKLKICKGTTTNARPLSSFPHLNALCVISECLKHNQKIIEKII